MDIIQDREWIDSMIQQYTAYAHHHEAATQGYHHHHDYFHTHSHDYEGYIYYYN